MGLLLGSVRNKNSEGKPKKWRQESCQPISACGGCGGSPFFQAKQWLRPVGLEQEVGGPHLQVEAAAASIAEEEEHVLFGAVRETWGSKMFPGNWRHTRRHTRRGRATPSKVDVRHHGTGTDRISDLTGGHGVAAFDGASEGWAGAANEASCQVALLLQVGPTRVLLSAGGLAEDAGHDAAVPIVVGLFQLIRVKVLGYGEPLRCSTASFSVCLMVSGSSAYPSLVFNSFICVSTRSATGISSFFHPQQPGACLGYRQLRLMQLLQLW